MRRDVPHSRTMLLGGNSDVRNELRRAVPVRTKAAAVAYEDSLRHDDDAPSKYVWALFYSLPLLYRALSF